MTYAILPDSVMDAWPGLSPSAKAVVVAVASFMNGSHGACWPSRAALMKRGGLRRAYSVSRAVSELQHAGVLAVIRRPNQTSVYSWILEGTENVLSGKYGKPTFQKPEGTENVPPEGTESVPGKYTTEVVNPSAEGKEAIPSELQGLELYEVDVKLLKGWPSLLKSWERAYPLVDISGEVAKAHAWEVANPQKRKTDRARFLTNWLGRVTVEPLPAEAEPPRLPQAFIDEMEGKAAS